MRAAAVAWVLLASVAAWATPRSDLARDFVGYLKAKGLPVTVTKQTEDDLQLSVVIDGHQANPSIALDNLEQHIGQAMAGGASRAEAENDLFPKYLSSIRGFNDPKPTLAHDGARLLPRLVPAGYGGDKVLRIRKLGDTGLEIAVVFDAEGSVRFLTAADATALGLDGDKLRELALENLARTWPADTIRKIVTNGGLNLVKQMDSFDAARLLLLQAALKSGESVAALVPDRDTLVVLPVPRDGDWSKLHALAQLHASGDHPLLARPLLVTRDKIELR